MNIAAMLTRALERLGIPIFGVSIGNPLDRATWRIDYKPEATAQQIASGDALKLSYDPQADATYASEQEQVRFDGEKLVKAVAVWTAQRLGVPLATARSEILAIYRGL
jgi:hypothetical protein